MLFVLSCKCSIFSVRAANLDPHAEYIHQDRSLMQLLHCQAAANQGKDSLCQIKGDLQTPICACFHCSCPDCIGVLRYCACIAVIHAVRTYKSISFLHAPFMISDVQEYMRCSLLNVTVTIGKAGLLICSLYAMITFFLSAARSRSPAALTSPSCSRRFIFIALTVTPRSVDFAFVALKRASAPALLTCSHSFGLWRRYFCFAFSKIARSSSPLAA